MREALRAFERVSRSINERNKRLKAQRFYRLFDTDKQGRVTSFGVYDSVAKRYVVFETINFAGNFRYNSADVPAEVKEMLDLVKNG
jgi:Ca2+-binding EF-hand superfamily protein